MLKSLFLNTRSGFISFLLAPKIFQPVATDHQPSAPQCLIQTKHFLETLWAVLKSHTCHRRYLQSITHTKPTSPDASKGLYQSHLSRYPDDWLILYSDTCQSSSTNLHVRLIINIGRSSLVPSQSPTFLRASNKIPLPPLWNVASPKWNLFTPSILSARVWLGLFWIYSQSWRPSTVVQNAHFYLQLHLIFLLHFNQTSSCQLSHPIPSQMVHSLLESSLWFQHHRHPLHQWL